MGIYMGFVLLRGWLLEAEGAMTEKRSEEGQAGRGAERRGMAQGEGR